VLVTSGVEGKTIGETAQTKIGALLGNVGGAEDPFLGEKERGGEKRSRTPFFNFVGKKWWGVLNVLQWGGSERKKLNCYGKSDVRWGPRKLAGEESRVGKTS